MKVENATDFKETAQMAVVLAGVVLPVKQVRYVIKICMVN